ncbi:MAG: nicotinate phosphoribosyltransferase [Acidimicrobiia bacterium]|nr:nicotinate phosphoribosyltransferase [Acidimicrobiia bacterium]
MVLTTGILFTDHYQLTMAQLYFRAGLADRRARFEHSFRSYPDYGTHQAGYAIAAGLGPFVQWLQRTSFDEEAAAALATLRAGDGGALFGEDFLDWMLESGSFDGVSLWAVPEGRVVHRNTPIAVVEAPLVIAQLLESSLLNHLNYATLIATKASRVVEAAHGGSVLEFGLRRAHGFGGNGASRSALIGGAEFSSNVGMSHELGLPSKGTHGHSMVQVFMSIAGGELEAFRAYADVYPDDCLLLVDTINTLESGVPNAIRVFEELKAGGHRPVGIRLDSGDLAHLAVRSAAMLNAAGFADTSIVLSSQLDELTIWQIRNQIVDEAPRYGLDVDRMLARLVYGVGSRMATSDGDPSFDGVYKAVAVKDDGGTWQPAIKISDSPDKLALPGVKTLWRVYDERGIATADVIATGDEDLSQRPLEILHPTRPGVARTLETEQVSAVEPLLESVLDDGRLVAETGGIVEARNRRTADLNRLDTGVRRLVNPHTYHVSVTRPLLELKQTLIDTHRS